MSRLYGYWDVSIVMNEGKKRPFEPGDPGCRIENRGDSVQVMVVDMLEGFTRQGPLASDRVDALVPEQARFLSSLPPDSWVVFLGDAHEPDDAELERFPAHCLRGSPEAEIRSELLAAARDAGAKVDIVHKRTFSGFVGTRLEMLLSSAVEKSWIVFGCVTDCCVETAVADLAFRGCRVTVARNLINTWDLSAEQAAAAGLSPAHVHDADAINAYWFDHRFEAIWGARVVDSWRELVKTDV